MRKSHLVTIITLTLLLALTSLPAFAAKVAICHLPPGNPANWHTINVSENALDAHLAHGDLWGSCLDNCEFLCDDGDACTQNVEANAEECVCLIEPVPVDCDDGNPCTFDSCSSAIGACVYDAAILNGTSCDDGDPGTTGEVCTDGVCAAAALTCPCWTLADIATWRFPAPTDSLSCNKDLDLPDSLTVNYDHWNIIGIQPNNYELRVATATDYFGTGSRCVLLNAVEGGDSINLFEPVTPEELAVCEAQLAEAGAARGFDCFGEP